MAVIRQGLLAAITLLSGLALVPSVWAQEAGSNKALGGGQLVIQPDEIARQLDKIDAGQPTGDPRGDPIGARVDDLEASRAAMDRKSGAPISLSVSGWALGEIKSR